MFVEIYQVNLVLGCNFSTDSQLYLIYPNIFSALFIINIVSKFITGEI